VLQYRSVAFVTYKHELAAQFAKESMACQSLDNDEILNVRWATEDPNPTSKVSEKRRLEEAGQAAIRARMDPRIVEAMRAVRALEDGDAPPGAAEDEEMIEDGRDGMFNGDGPAKRRRIEGPEGDVKEEEAEVEEVREVVGAPPAAPGALLNQDTLEGLKYFAEIRRRKEEAKAPAGVVKPLPQGMGLADYGSDEED
jgi:hypothetical protein